MNIKAVTLIFLLLFSQLALSQNEASKWYFGYTAGLDFATNPPTVLSNGRTHAVEGTASVADALGNLLFYTDGDTVWNSNHQIMANGLGLFGTTTSDQAALIIKQPGATSSYFIFTTDGQASPNGLCYSKVDMTLAAGMGSVTSKNTQLATPVGEKLTATLHCNGIDIWVVAHDMYSNVFRAYLVTAAGVNQVPVLSPIGTVHTFPAYGPAGGSQGNMKISPNGRKLALAMVDLDSYELYDFDNASGVISNSLILGTGYVQAYCVEFSPDNSKLYGTRWATQDVFQWDLCGPSNSAIVNSMYSFTTNVFGLSGMQLAPNGKIYVINVFQQCLETINNPNALGAASNFSINAIPFPNMLGYTLPNFMTAYFSDPVIPPPFTYTINPAMSCLTASFTSPTNQSAACTVSGYSVTGHLWSFGDPASGPANTSVLPNPLHTYSGPGNYQVRLILYTACSSDTLWQQVTTSTGNLSITTTPVGCYTQGSATVIIGSGTGPFAYTWTPSAQTTSVAANLAVGNYSVNVENAAGCVYFGTTAITYQNILSGTLATTDPLCGGNSTGSATIAVAGLGQYNYVWSGTAQTTSVVTGLAPGIYTVNVSDQLSPCTLTATFQINGPLPLPLNTSADTVCIGQTLNLYASSQASVTYSWSGPNGFVSSQQNPSLANANLAMAGIYSVVATSNDGCVAGATVYALVLPSFTASAVSNTPCLFSTLNLTAGSAFFYQWTGPNNFSSSVQNPLISNVTAAAAGIYSLVMGMGSCKDSAFIAVTVNPLPQPEPSNTAPVCETNTLQLIVNNSGVGYTWTGPGGYNSNQQNPVFMAMSAAVSGMYTVTVIDNNNCQASATTSVTIIEAPTAVAIPTSACSGQSVNLTGSGGNIYIWDGPASFTAIGQSVDFVATGPQMSGTYTLTVFGTGNCSSNATVQVAVYALPNATVAGFANVCAPVCTTMVLKKDNGQLPFTSTTFFINSEIYNAAELRYCFKTAGNYLIRAWYKDTNNCANTSTLQVLAYETPVADFEFTPLRPMAAVDKVTFNNASSGKGQISWTWFFIDNTNDSLTGERVAYLFETAGNYPIALVVKNKWGCVDTAIKHLVIEDEFSLYVPNAFTPNGDGLNDVFQPKGTGIKNYVLTIFDRWGAQLFQTTEFINPWSGSYHGAACKEDVYTWKITAAGSDGKTRELQGHVTLYR